MSSEKNSDYEEYELTTVTCKTRSEDEIPYMQNDATLSATPSTTKPCTPDTTGSEVGSEVDLEIWRETCPETLFSDYVITNTRSMVVIILNIKSILDVDV